ncbi:alternative cyclin Pho80 [Kwoniella heveanensis CBS 569]|uniref:Alternative cyclin Pho80 n=1 Tax=Kwoniella heveanensis BCC8398 TaxID=1296120 RepID=A0A1B9GPP6_9TREE|nr:alternative cyclin Pho80 [Kwoniella heveanensis BCC8398]OCF44251.1 alternative cyclin Pho80 [Kwoniella heveanensis CBS 569]
MSALASTSASVIPPVPTPTSSEPIVGPPNPSNPPELPYAFIDCPLNILVDLLSHMLDLLIKHNDQVVLTPDALTRFHSRAAPGISVVDYLRRIVKYTNLEKIPLLSLLAYIDTTCTNLPTFTLSSLTVHRFLIASVCAGSKAQCDVFCTNAHYAKVGGIKTQELNALERELVKVTKWDLCCHAEQLQKYYSSLIRSHGGYVQAPAPEVPRFLPFPRSNSKRRSTAPSPTSDPAAGPTAAPADDDERMDQSSGDEEEADRDDMVVDDDVSPTSDQVRGRSKTRNSTKKSRNSSAGDVGMEVDSNSPSSPIGVSEALGNDNEAGPSTSPVYSAASSSVPSSTRSSIRGSINRGRRGRVASISVSDPKLAEPRVDTTPITVSPQSHSDDNSSPSKTQPASVGRRTSLRELNALNGSLGANRPGPGSPLATSSHLPGDFTTNNSTDGTNVPPQSGATQPVPTLSAPIPVPAPTSRRTSSSTMSKSPGAAGAVGTSTTGTTPHSHSSGGKLLKSLVGGIFRRKSIPGDDGPSITSASSSVDGQKSHMPRVASKYQPGNVALSRPLATPSSTKAPPPTADSHQRQGKSHEPQYPISHSPRLIATSPRVQAAAAGGSSTSTHGQAQPPKQDGERQSPGLAKPVTPRVRTRQERSIDPHDRVALGGSAIPADITTTAGPAGAGDTAGTAAEGDESGKRSKA